METDSLGDIVFERLFEYADANGNNGIIQLRVGIPYIAADTNSEVKWRCPYQLVGTGSGRVHTVMGIDAIDALLLSLRMTEAWFKSYSKLRITWQGEDYLGLSFPELSLDNNVDMSDADSPFKKVFDEFFRKFDNQRKHEDS